MKLEEKIINGVLHYRWYPNNNFEPYTKKELTSIIFMKRKENGEKSNKKIPT